MDMRVAAYAVVTDDAGRVLLARWIEGGKAAWTMPGGGLEDGEDPAVAVRREVREETGYSIRVDELLGIHSRVLSPTRRLIPAKNPLHTLRIVYRAHTTRGKLRFEKNGSTDMAGWFRLDEIAALPQVSLVGIALKMAGMQPSRSSRPSDSVDRG